MSETEFLIAYQQIYKITSEFYNQTQIYQDICQSIIKSLGFEFVGISLVFPEKNTIECVCGTGLAEKWAGRVKHHIEPEPKLRDIQADIIQTYKTEIISGWDDRFDRWVYDEFEHDQLVRVFTPMILVRDINGNLLQDWFNTNNLWKVTQEQNSTEGQHTIIEIDFTASNYEIYPDEMIVIGTLETGYKSRDRTISTQEAIKLAKLASQKALEIRRVSLSYIFETIVEEAKSVFNAHSSSLHFHECKSNDYNVNYFYNVSSGAINLKQFPPRKNGLGQKAIKAKGPKFIPNPDQGHSHSKLEYTNPNLYKAGVKAMAAFPISTESMSGVLYIAFQEEHKFENSDFERGQYFSDLAVNAIHNTIRYEEIQEQANQMVVINSVAQFLTRKSESGKLLHYIAWNVINILAADVVTIYEYINSENRFLTPPEIAGKLLVHQEMTEKLSQRHVPFKLIDQERDIYAPDLGDHPEIFDNSPFVKREKIKSVGAVLLKVDEDIVGLMFINYRRHHIFSENEKQTIDTLASSVAIAIKNQRKQEKWFEALDKIDREIITTLDKDKLLKSIVQKAVEITGADFGGFLKISLTGQELVTQINFPDNKSPDAPYYKINIDETSGEIEGITGWVAKDGKSLLINDVRQNPRYKPFHPDVNAELCVPLLDGNHIIGVLNVESKKKNAFNARDIRKLEALANQAVMATQKVENQEQLIATEKLNAYGELASSVMHKMNNDLKAIQNWSEEILEEQRIKISNNNAKDILNTTNKLLEEVKKLDIPFENIQQPINIRNVINQAIETVNIPRRIEVTKTIPNELPKIAGNEESVTKIFYNLIRNAIEAMNNWGKLTIDVQVKEENALVVKITDTGTGIDQDCFEKIFQIGFSTKHGDRLGIGLPFVKLCIQRLGGRINVRNNEQQGSTFIVILPIY